MSLKISAKEQLMIIGTAAFLLLVLFGFFVVYPNISKLIQINDEKSKLATEISSAEAALVRLKDLKRDASRLEANLAELKVRLPDEPEMPTMIIDLNKIAKDAGIEFIQITQAEWVEKTGYTEIPLKITMNGRYYDVIDFLYRLRFHSREIMVMSITIGEGPSGLPQISAIIEAKTFTLRLPFKEQAEQAQGAI